MRKALRRSFIAAAVLIGLLVLTVPAIWLYLQTDLGLRHAARLLGSALSSEDERIAIGAVDHVGFWRLEASSLAASDAAGTWLEIDGLVLDWSWGDILDLSFRPRLLAVNTARLSRIPARQDAEARKPVTLPLLPAARISIRRLELAEVAIGEAVAASIDGAEVATETGDRELMADVKRIDGPEGSLTLHAVYRPADDTLALRGILSEGEGGVLGRLLDVPDAPAYRVALSGEGPRTGWRGTLEIDADGRPLGEGDVRLSLEDTVTAAFNGRLYASPRLGATLERALGDRAALAIDVGWDRADQVTISRAVLDAAAFHLETSGRLGLDDELFEGQARLRAAELASLPYLEDIGSAGAVEITFAGAMPLSQPAGDLDIRLTALRSGGLGAKVLTARGRLDTLSPLSEPGTAFRLRLAGTIEGPERLPGSIELALGDQIDWSFDGRYRMADGTINLDAFDARGAHVYLAGSGILPQPYDEARASIDYGIDELAWFEAPAGLRLEGRLNGSADIVAALSAGTIGATLIAQGEELSFGSASLDELLGPTPDLAGRFDINSDGTIRFAALELGARFGSLRGEGLYVSTEDRVTAALRLDVPSLAAFSGMVGTSLRGATTIEATLDGSFDALNAMGTLAASGVETEGVALDRLKASFSAADLLGLPKAKLKAQFTAKGVAAELETELALADSDMLRVSGLKASAPDLSLTGNLGIGLGDGLVMGKARAQIAKLDNWARLVDLDLTGSATLDAALDVKGGRQSAALDLSGTDLALSLPDRRPLRARSMTARTRIEDVWGAQKGDATARLRDAESNGVTLSSFSVTASGTRRAWQVGLETEGAAERTFRIDASAVVETPMNGATVRLERLEGRYGALPVRLRETATLRLAAGRGDLDRLALALGEGMVELAGIFDGARVDATAQARGVPLALVRALVPSFRFDGTARMDAALTGAAANPTARATLEISDFRSTLPDAPSGTLNARGDLSDGRLAAELRLTGLGEAPIDATFAMPMQLSLDPVTLGLDGAAPIQGRVEGDVDLALIAPLLPLDEDRLEGRVHIEASLAGSLERPEASGRALLANGRYENFMTAARLENIHVEIDGDGDAIELRSLSAQGAGGGQVTGRGRVRLDAAQQFPLTLELSFDQLWVARLDAVSSRASGALALAGNLEAMAMTGRIAVGPAELLIPERLPPSVRTLDVIELNPPGERPSAAIEAGARPGAEPSRSTPITLDIALEAPRRVFVRGRGLDSEWAGAINLRGDLDNPRFDGALRVVRGYFELLGKRFDLREGAITMDEAAPLDPTVDLLAEAVGGGITAQVRLQGSLKAPELTLSSEPELPPDEVLSRVLFNKSVGQLSAVEAVQLAESAAVLAGRGGASGALERLRRTAGFDVLSVGAEGQGASVSAGKYLSEDVLLRIEQGSRSGSSRVGVEVEVTPNVSVETSSGASGESEVGINWKWDY